MSFQFFMTTLLGLCLVACTRPTADTAEVSFKVPGLKSDLKPMSQGFAQSASTDDENSFYLAINVTGAGNNVICTFDSKDGASTGPCSFAFPNVSLPVQLGTGLLFQVMLAEDGEDGLDLSYGEKSTDLKTGGSVPVTIASILQAGDSGHVDGRYIAGTPASPSYPTGLLSLKFAPPSGSRPMTVLQSEMFAGWFRGGRALTGVSFHYEVDSQRLFPSLTGGLSFSTFASLVGSTFEQVLEDGAADFYYFGGFMGPGVNPANQFAYASQGTCVTQGKTLYGNCLDIDEFEGTSPFRGPFKPTASGTYLVMGTPWTYDFLPGISSAAIDGVKLIKLSGITDPQVSLRSYALDEGRWNCEKLLADGIEIASIPVANKTFSDSLVPGLNSSNALFLCPYKGNRLFTTAVAYPEYVNQFARDGYRGPYLHLNFANFTGNQGPQKWIKGSCNEVRIGLYEGHGQPRSAASLLNVALPPAAGMTYYTDDTCTTAVADSDGDSLPDVAIPFTFTESDPFYVKASSEGLSVINYFHPSAPGVPQEVAVAKGRLVFEGPSTANAGECVAVHIRHESGDGQALPSHQTLNLNLLGSGLTIYGSMDRYCSQSPESSVTLSSGMSSSDSFYVKKTSSGEASINLDPAQTSIFASYNVLSLSLADRIGGLAVTNLKLQVATTGPLNLQSCYPVDLFLLNDQQERVPSSTLMNIPLASQTGKFFLDPFCFGPETRLAVLEAGESGTRLFYQPTQATAGASIALTPGSGLPGYAPIQVAAPPAAAPTSGPALRIVQKPSFAALIIGSHEFGAERLVQLGSAAGTTVSCQKMTPPSPSWHDCTNSDFTAGASAGLHLLKWKDTEAVAGTIYRFEGRKDGQFQSLDFNPSIEYNRDEDLGVGRQTFQVIQCDHTPTASLNSDALDSLFDTHSIVCLPLGVQILANGSTPLVLNKLGVSRSLIGWSTARNVVNPAATGPTLVMTANDGVTYQEAPVLANLEVRASASTPAIEFKNSSSGSEAWVRWSNLKVLSGSGAANKTISIYNNGNNIHLVIADLELVLGNSWTGLSVFENGNSGAASEVTIDRAEISPVDATAIKGFVVETNTAGKDSSLALNGLKMQVALATGSALQILGTENSMVELERARVVRASGTASVILVQNPNAVLQIKDSFFKSLAGNPILNIAPTAPSLQMLNLQGNTFVSGGTVPSIAFSTAGLSIANFDMVGNSFVGIGAGSRTILQTSEDLSFGDSAYSPAAGLTLGNRVCYSGTTPQLISAGKSFLNGILPPASTQIRSDLEGCL